MYQNRHFKCLTAFQKEKKETTMNLRKKLLDKKIIKFGKKIELQFYLQMSKVTDITLKQNILRTYFYP